MNYTQILAFIIGATAVYWYGANQIKTNPVGSIAKSLLGG